jgi:hypothetical protein
MESAERIPAPKAIGGGLGLRPETEIDLIERGDANFLEASEDVPALAMHEGLLVHKGVEEKGARWDSLVDDVREDRTRFLTS